MDLVKIFGEELAEQIKAKLPEGKTLILNDGKEWIPKARFNEQNEKQKAEIENYKGH